MDSLSQNQQLGMGKYMAKRRSGLGKGLEALIPSTRSDTIREQGVRTVPIEAIIPNPHQPRINFHEFELQELAQSIMEHGVLQPLIVTEDAKNKGFTLIAGERRLQAAKIAKLSRVPVIVREVSEQERLEIALIENVQRADLSPLEKAEAYKQLSDEFNLTHEQIGTRVGISRVAVTNTLRLLNLPAKIQDALSNGLISEGHARVLLSLPSAQAQVAALKAIIDRGLNVRQTEELVKKLVGVKPPKKRKSNLSPELLAIEEQLRSRLGTKVRITHGARGGTITLHYYSDEEFEHLLRQIMKD